MNANNFSFIIDGVLAGMAMPGAFSPIEEDLAALRDAEVGAIVSLTESGLDASVVKDNGFDYLHLPVRDLDAPALSDVARFRAFQRSHEAAGRAVVVHCRVGQGRTGTMLACALVDRGYQADEAIALLRRLRRGSINSRAQERFIAAYAAKTRV